ncbi:eukaryotic translation initiation factor 3 subunit F [Blastomyces dermatitidis ER-3]|uniref:Eukaryotic translation initiation factor 3 subunit F n=2 Tax=Blastomyces TaxID=229219 RepID=A0A179UKU3_BLAGS|nr:eukaryotic translation initiation factor 3 subunit F [Blastomyces gilchristii SLH14081]XP_045274338.1 eukaryotic translation initiation factor 3 subunit F [Blastomyces dermatitidis ER-3]EEQ86890.1 eukaryotic translation initiation factor 3 subunit F [Blastomyces dermatitidis ER-3]EQL30723.1 eukaryotic translation initiation factor 3 subunit F [Blastomyces dermatitidis ATCC 26199]OAT07858.1 eukaryotic translation initiation factor 3 subunit F [Blastomyces gilchristii SLH14081]
MADTDSFLHLSRPLGPAAIGTQPSTAPLNVVIQPQAIFSILDHSLRRNADQERVIGTLLGTRSEDGTEVEIRSCFAVGHTETTDQVEVDMEYQKQMLALHLKANPKEVLVGWYATSSELNTFSALIQNFYGGSGDGTWPHPAVHLTVSTVPGKDIETRTYISAPVGVTAERAADSAAFIPVPYEIRYGDAEKNGLEAIAAARDSENRTANLFTDIEALEKAIEDVLGMIDRVSRYVDSVMDEEAPASTALGQFLLNALALAPKVDPADIENDFNNHIQDVLVVSYLANTIRTQMELSNRLATAQLTLGGEGAGTAAAGGSGEAGGQRGGRGGGRGRGGQQRNQDRGGVEA